MVLQRAPAHLAKRLGTPPLTNECRPNSSARSLAAREYRANGSFAHHRSHVLVAPNHLNLSQFVNEPKLELLLSSSNHPERWRGGQDG